MKVKTTEAVKETQEKSTNQVAADPQEKADAEEEQEPKGEDEDEEKGENGGEREEKEKESAKQTVQKEVTSLVPKPSIESVIQTNDVVLNSTGVGASQQAGGLKKLEEKKKNVAKKSRFELRSITLNLGYNLLRSLDRFAENVMKVKGIPANFAANLMWIDLQHNYLVTLPRKEFEAFENLRSLYLHCNYILDLRELENLAGLKHLITLTIHGNPVDRIPHFR
jgi:Leucine-rich repeat (LRR) protein